MKVGTLTFHGADNYGANLQAYALPLYLRSAGIDCEIIDFRPQNLSGGLSTEFPCELISKYGFLKGCAKALNRKLRGYYSSDKKENRYARFSRKHLPLSAKKYYTCSELKNIDYEAVIFGSDQIWNKNLTAPYENVFFGEIGNEKVRKIAYAASCGNEKNLELVENVKEKLSGFYRISVREKQLESYIGTHFGIECENVVDPVFLLSEHDWRIVEGKLPKGLKRNGYIFVYTFDSQPVYDFARKLRQKTGLPIVVLRWCGVTKRLADTRQLYAVGPETFLSLIDNAAAVCTSSFHGLAFSLIFKKEFYCFSEGENASRTDNLLALTELDSRRITSDGSCLFAEPTDYGVVEKVLTSETEKSKAFLKEALSREV